jgi:hypothetical protein
MRNTKKRLRRQRGGGRGAKLVEYIREKSKTLFYSGKNRTSRRGFFKFFKSAPPLPAPVDAVGPTTPPAPVDMQPQTVADMQPQTVADMQPQTLADMQPQTLADMQPQTVVAASQPQMLASADGMSADENRDKVRGGRRRVTRGRKRVKRRSKRRKNRTNCTSR